MKHVRRISVRQVVQADAVSDFYNAIWAAWLNFLYAKKNETITTS
jgi:hypothetical protein